ncbi:hypothetical protein Poly30_35650 [Planctomycetes bacterium Poly30]|uniref:Secreted protein n=1 Tax=Saltatorellus ferox TaxID=2528018 RepID=A0A518EVA7_9BACT|nr:hypothetical protein Poly30_35650 [Planctomycetes bacterium Poly30]
MTTAPHHPAKSRWLTLLVWCAFVFAACFNGAAVEEARSAPALSRGASTMEASGGDRSDLVWTPPLVTANGTDLCEVSEEEEQEDRDPLVAVGDLVRAEEVLHPEPTTLASMSTSAPIRADGRFGLDARGPPAA